MTNWITCPGCGLKHSPRPDGLCPRCRTRTGAANSSPGPAPQQPPATQPFPPGPPPLDAAPLPTTPWGGGAPPAAPSPRVEITVGSLVSRTFSTWWSHVGAFTGMLLLVYLPIFGFAAVTAGVTAAAKRGGQPPDFSGPLLFGIIAVILVLSLFSLVAMGGITHGSLEHLAGRPVTFGAMLRAGGRRFWPLFLVGLAAWVLIMLGMMVLIVPGILVGLALAVSYPIVMSEEPEGTSAAMKRSMALTKGSRGTLFGTFVVVFLAAWSASLVAQLVTTFAAAAAGGSAAGPIAIVGLLFSVVVQTAMSSLMTVTTAVAYHDLRVAKEGVDTGQLAKVFE
jgi:hypothetical protein